MLRLIMVPLDGSAFAEQALPVALSIARRAHAGVHLVFVRPTLPLDGNGGDEYVAKIADQIEPLLPHRITHAVLTNEQGPLEYVPPGPRTVADVLARHSEEHDISLVVMSTHGHGGLRRAWIGSTADSLSRIAPRPVLLIRPHDETFSIAASVDRGINHIVIPLDGSESAERALPYALQIGELFDTRYTLVRFVSLVAWAGAAEAYAIARSQHPTPLDRRAAAEYLDAVVDRLRPTTTKVAAQLLEGWSAAPAILDYATTHAADLIVLTTAGAGGIRRLFLGSVADKIVRSGEVPVLVCNVHHLEEVVALTAAGATTAITQSDS